MGAASESAEGHGRANDLRAARRGDVRVRWDEWPTLEGGAMECGAPQEELTDVRAGVNAWDDGAWKGVDARERGVGAREGGSSVTSLSSKTEASVLSAFQMPEQRLRRGATCSSSVTATSHSLVK